MSEATPFLRRRGGGGAAGTCSSPSGGVTKARAPAPPDSVRYGAFEQARRPAQSGRRSRERRLL